jgi:ribosome biogenesis GTPase
MVSVDTSRVASVGVGDWCAVIEMEGTEADGQSFSLLRVFDRRSALVRQSSGNRTEAQVLASNMDAVMIVVPLDRAISPRQVERFLVLAWDSGAQPVVVLTKADLAGKEGPDSAQAEVTAISGDVPIILTSVVTGEGMPQVWDFVTPGRTVALLGTSGSGKSSLVNALSGTEVVVTGSVREGDNKGRHTTTWRELIVVPTGGAIIDTPGLRELGMWVDEDGINAAFSDVTDLAPLCRFNDCAHDSEPGCAVQAAIASGDLDPIRLSSYRKLLGEAAYAARKNDHRLAKEQQKIWKQRTQEGKSRARP